MCDRWIESIQKMLDVSALRREDGHVNWTGCADSFVAIQRRYVQIASDSVPNSEIWQEITAQIRSREPTRTRTTEQTGRDTLVLILSTWPQDQIYRRS